MAKPVQTVSTRNVVMDPSHVKYPHLMVQVEGFEPPTDRVMTPAALPCFNR